MPEKPPKDKDRDEPIRIPLDPEEALRGFLAVYPDSEPSLSGDPSQPDVRSSTDPK